MQRTLWVMRHGKSRWDKELPDIRRPLAKRGKRDAKSVGKWMHCMGYHPDLIISSPAKRARTTARRVAKANGYEGTIAIWPGLYEGDVDDCLRALSHLPPDIASVMIIGHNPLLEELVLLLAERSVDLRTAHVAHLVFDAACWIDVPNCVGELRSVVSPNRLS